MQKVRLYASPALRLFFILLCVAWAILIFSMSAETASESNDRSREIATEIAPIVVPEYKILPQPKQQSIVSQINHITRKAAHFALFTGFGVLLCLACFGYSMTRFWHVGLPFLLGVAYAGTDEIHQKFVPNRGPGFTDILIDSSGVLFGILIVFGVLFLYKAIRNRMARKKKTA